MKRHHFTTELAEALEVSRSGWDMHTRKEQRPRRRQDRQLSAALKPLFIENRRTYGSPRLTRCLHRQGQRCGKNRIARLMRELGLRACQKRRFRPQTTHSGHGLSVAANWLARVPTPDRLNQIWIADITYLPTTEGWLYLAGILDACSRRCIGWQIGESLQADLVIAAWRKACNNRGVPAGLIHHSDRGVQYASGDFQNQLSIHGVTPSMSRKGNCYDNAEMESFWATLKTEAFGDNPPTSKSHTKLMIFDYIETFYNPKRLHSSLNYQSPLEFERSFLYTKPLN